MTISFTRTGALIFGFGLILASPVFGQTTTFTFLNDALGQYTMPYTGTTSAGGPVVNVLCDDYSDEINFNQSFTADVTDVGSITDSTSTVYYTSSITNTAYTGTALGSDPTITEQEDYIAAAYLAIQITELNPLGGTTASELSDAVWNIFQPGSVGLDAVARTDLNTALETAVSYAGLGSAQAIDNALGKDVTIYTPLDPNNGYAVYQEPGAGTADCPAGYATDGSAPNGICTRPQEFLTVSNLPEPSTWAFLGFDFAGAGIVGLYFRRRKSSARS